MASLVRAAVLIILILLGLNYLNPHRRQQFRARIIQNIPKNIIQDSPPIVLKYLISQVPPEKQTEIASLSAEIASASTNFDPWSQQKVKQLKLAILDEIYKSILNKVNQ